MNVYHFPFDPELLTTFMAVADAGRISAAAKVLNISQPSVTAHLHKLESELKAQLFKRSVNGVQLTESGQKLLDHSKKIQALIDEAAKDVSEKKVPRGHLSLAASTTVAAHVLPPLLAEFRKRYSEITLGLEIANTEDVLKKIRSGKVPLGLVEGHARAPSIKLEAFMEDEIVLVAAANSPVIIRRTQDLLNQTLIVREPGSGTRAVIERAFKKIDLKHKDFKNIIEIGSSEAIKSAVIAGLGLSFLSRSSIQNEVALGKLNIIPLSDLHISRTFHWALPAGGLSGPAEEFYRFTKQMARST